MILRFKKMKFMTSLFYKSAENLRVEIDGDNIDVTVLPYLSYCNSYTLLSKHSEDFEKTTYIAIKNIKGYNLSEDKDLMMANVLNIINTIIIYKGYRKFIVFDNKKDGVILKN